MSSPNPYESDSQNPELQENQAPPPPQPGYASPQPQSPTEFQQPGYYPPPGAQAPYEVPAATPYQGARFAIAGLILGIVSVISAIFPICGLPFAIVGIIVSVLGRRSLTRRTMATAGLVLSIIGIVLSVISAVVSFAYFSHVYH
ncbi:MAG TPA: hypothetical protein VF026_26830 [Ktedonobacteraceae bacterium]